MWVQLVPTFGGNMKNKSHLIVALLLAIFCIGSLCVVACGSSNTADETNTYEANTYEELMEQTDEIFTVLDVREKMSRGNMEFNTIVVILESESGGRVPFEYTISSSSLNGRENSNATYKNLQILVPGDKVKYAGDNEFKIVKE